jgi:hypothetical protein
MHVDGRWRRIALFAVAGLWFGACGGDTTGGAGGPTCAEGRRCVTEEITADTTWTADQPVELADLVFVTHNATLTIEAGTQILGDAGSALIITRGARLDAQGTAATPIVFTSSKTVGERQRGFWGGVVLLGSAPVNVGTGQIEGIDASDTRGAYGGTDSSSNCGTLRYVRVEFAGYTLGADNELNGLTVGGCGSGTTLDYIQIHMGEDDGIEFFGGNADLRHAVISRPADDGLDWDEGFSGRVQFLVVQQEAAVGDNGFEADNLETNNDATPRSQPTIYNATLIGGNDTAAAQRAMTLRRGTAGEIWDILMTGFGEGSIDIRDTATVNQIDQGNLSLGALLFFHMGPDGSTYFPAETGDGDDDGGFDESAYFHDSNRDARFDQDPKLGACFNLDTPNFIPAADSPAADGVVPISDGWFDTTADYIGAFQPGATSTWMDGWTSFPEN